VTIYDPWESGTDHLDLDLSWASRATEVLGPRAPTLPQLRSARCQMGIGREVGDQALHALGGGIDLDLRMQLLHQ
jgi:hypothetical protein